MAQPIRAIRISRRYTREFRKLSRPIQDRLISQEKLFRADWRDPRVRAHRLHGALKHLWSYSIDFRHRILFEFTASDEVLYLDVGTHEVYE